MNQEKECLYVMHSSLIPSLITNTFQVFTINEYLLKFDQTLCEELQDMRNWRQSVIFHDVSYTMRMHASRFKEPMELQALIVILKTISRYAQLAHKAYHEGGSFLSHNTPEDIIYALCMILSNFIQSCQMPELINLTVSCIVDVLELVLHVDVAEFDDPTELFEFENLLKKLCIGDEQISHLSDSQHIVQSPFGQEIICRTQRRLNSIRPKLYKFDQYDFPTILSLVSHT